MTGLESLVSNIPTAVIIFATLKGQEIYKRLTISESFTKWVNAKGEEWFKVPTEKITAKPDEKETHIPLAEEYPNLVKIYSPRTGEFYFARFDQIKEQLKRQIDSNSPEKLRLVTENFYPALSHFDDFVSSGDSSDEAIDPYVKYFDDDTQSILLLSKYVKYYIERHDHKNARTYKDQIAKFYGYKGNRVCNLYLQEYLQELILGYIAPLVQEKASFNDIRSRVIVVFSRIVRETAEVIFFISDASDKNQVISKIRNAIASGKPFIAVHGAGFANVSRVTEILNEVTSDVLKAGYGISPVKDKEFDKRQCNTLDVYFTRT